MCILFVFNHTILEDRQGLFCCGLEKKPVNRTVRKCGLYFRENVVWKKQCRLNNVVWEKKNSNLTKLNYTFTKQCRVEKEINNVVWRKNCRFLAKGATPFPYSYKT